MLLRFILLTVFVFLFWKAVKPYVLPALSDKPPPPDPLPPKRKPKTDTRPRIEGKLPHEILGVREDARLSEIQEAYKRLVAEHHPDKVATEGEDRQKRALARTQAINQAYEAMTRGRG